LVWRGGLPFQVCHLIPAVAGCLPCSISLYYTFIIPYLSALSTIIFTFFEIIFTIFYDFFANYYTYV
jgi:hypothetical protein